MENVLEVTAGPGGSRGSRPGKLSRWISGPLGLRAAGWELSRCWRWPRQRGAMLMEPRGLRPQLPRGERDNVLQATLGQVPCTL